jgi:hypothetical protein
MKASYPTLPIDMAVALVRGLGPGLRQKQCIAVRGDDYVPKSAFRRSAYHGDDGRASRRLPGVSASLIAWDTAWGVRYRSFPLRKTLEGEIVQGPLRYGSNVFLVSGVIVERGEDDIADEVIVGGHRILCRLDLRDAPTVFPLEEE